MLTKDEAIAMAREAGFYDGRCATWWCSSEDVERFAQFVEARTRAAARAEVEPLVRQMMGALENLLAAVRGECPALLDEDRGGSAYLGMDADDVIAAAGAWLSPQDKENDHA